MTTLLHFANVLVYMCCTPTKKLHNNVLHDQSHQRHCETSSSSKGQALVEQCTNLKRLASGKHNRHIHGSTDHTTLCVMHESLVCCRLKAQAMKLNTHRHIMLCLITQAIAAAADSLLCDPA